MALFTALTIGYEREFLKAGRMPIYTSLANGSSQYSGVVVDMRKESQVF